MQLNETTARVDGQLDSLVKKIEKIQLDTSSVREQNNLTYKVNYAGPGIPYSEYVRTFKWESLKYPTKRSLNELTVAIQKGVHQKDEQIRKNLDEYTGLKNRISGMTKKEGGSLQVKDFTDDLYNNEKRPELFVEHFESEMF